MRLLTGDQTDVIHAGVAALPFGLIAAFAYPGADWSFRRCGGLCCDKCYIYLPSC
jgi:hypothetical protein